MYSVKWYDGEVPTDVLLSIVRDTVGNDNVVKLLAKTSKMNDLFGYKTKTIQLTITVEETE